MVHREFAQEKQSMTDANQQLLDQVERMKRENENMLLQMQRLQDEADLQLPAGQNAAVGGGGGIVDRGDGGGGLGGGMFGIVSGQGGGRLIRSDVHGKKKLLAVVVPMDHIEFFGPWQEQCQTVLRMVWSSTRFHK